MKTKLAFLAAVAAMMVPGFALAQVDATFPTTIDFTNDDTGTVNVELTCNSGNPLVQDFDISEAAGVTFTVTGLVADSVCDVALSGLASGYELTNAPCSFTITDATTYACDLVAAPIATVVMVYSSVDAGGDTSIDTGFETTITCDNVSADTGPVFGSVTTTDMTGAFAANWYAEPGETADCTATLVGDDSAVEGDACAFSFVLGDATTGCTLEGTVFFEGIPTLSQYGMAVMVLLMLGVGFVGFRRFV